MEQSIQKPIFSFSVMSFTEMKERIRSIMDIYDVGFIKAIQIWFWPEKGRTHLLKQVSQTIKFNHDEYLQEDFAVRVLAEFLANDISSVESQHIRLEVIARLSCVDRIVTGKQEWLVATIVSCVDAYVVNGGSARIAIGAIEPNLFCLMALRPELMLKHLNKDAAAQEYQRMAMTVLGSDGFQYNLSKFGHGDHCAWARTRLDYAYQWLLKARSLLRELKRDCEFQSERRCVFIETLLNQIRATDLEITTQWSKTGTVMPPKQWPDAS